MRGAGAGLKELGSEARAAGSAIGGGLSQGVSAAQSAPGRIRGLMSSIRTSLAAGARQGIGQLGLQVQDIAVQLEAGVSPLRVFIQQGSQIAGAFGPAGAAIGAVAAVAGGLAAAFFGARDGMSAAEAAAQSFKTAMDGVNDVVGSGVTAAEKLIKSYEGMSAGMRKLEMLRLTRETREANKALEEQDRTVQDLLGDLQRAADIRFAAAGGSGDFGGLEGFRAVGPAIAAFRAGGDIGELADTLQRLSEASPELEAMANTAVSAAIAAAELRAQLEQLGQAKSSLADLATGAGQELGRLEGMLQRIDAAVDTSTMSFRDMYQDVVGGSYVPDLVQETGSWFDRMRADMTEKTDDATSSVSSAFDGLNHSVSFGLGQMIARNKLALTDFADFAQDILGRILGQLISVGISAGIDMAFAPSPAIAGGGGSDSLGGSVNADTLHRGGIVGAAGNPKTQAPLSLWAGAQRYHRGGTVLRPGEVPVIAMRGERVVPAGQDAGGRMTVIINDQRRGGEAIETRERRGPGGERQLEVTIRDAMTRSVARSEQDAAMAARFGLRPGLGSR